MATTNKGIYYPNNYSNVADVPEDMKKLAESVDTVVGNLDTNKVDKVDGKGLSTNDFTNEYKAKLDGLNNYDDTEITQEIEDIQEEQTKQNEDIEDLKRINAKQDDLIQKLKDNCINVTTEEATSLHVTDASTLPAKLEVRGGERQDGIPTPDTPVEVEAVGDNGSVEIKKLTENVINLSKSVALYNTEITEIDEENGIIKVHRTNTQDPSIQIFCNLPAGQYTMLHNSHNFGQVSVYGKNKIVDIGSEKYKIFNATENITDIRIYSGSELPTDYEINFSDIILVMGNVAREDIKYVKYQESSYILDIQQPMLSGDYFIKEADDWKEVHTFGYVNTREVENLGVSLNTSNGEFRRYNAYNLVTDRKSGEYLKILCTHFKRTDSRWHENEGICGWETGQSFCIGTFNTNYDTVDRMKTFLQNNDVGIYYELATPTKLACTEEQSAILDQLSELELFKGTNNIITAEGLALMQMQYIADTETYIDNKIDEKLANINQQILNIVGGN